MRTKKHPIIPFLLLGLSPLSLFSQENLKNLEVLYTIFDPSFPASGLNAQQIGENVCFVGDVNGDGYDDWAVGLKGAVDYGSGLTSGTVHVYYGGELPESESKADLIIGGWVNIFSLGSKIAAAGDVNNDGFDDLLVRYIEHDGTFTEIWPRVSLYLGGDPFDPQPDITFSGREGYNNYNFGMVSGAGDVNGDGYDDVIIGAPTEITGPDTAHAYLYFGGDPMDASEDLFFTGDFYPPGNPNSGAGSFAFEVSGAGDMNNDGYDDLLINGGASSKIYFGGSNMDHAADVLLEIEGAGTGATVSDVGDVNHDGYDDVILGAKVAGNAYLFLGGETVDPSADLMVSGDTDWDYFGRSVSGAGDVNGDGFDDFMIGSDVNGMGKAWVYFGASQPDNTADAVFSTNIFGDRFGYTVSGGGDLDGDGYADLIVGGIGDYTNWIPEDDAGSIYLFSGGEPLENEPEASFNGIASMPSFGSPAAYGGDVNGDGYPDLIVGDADYKPGIYNVGEALLYLGSEDHDGQADMKLAGNHDDWHYNFGGIVCCAGDVNNDGYSDLFVGETNMNTDECRSYLFFGGESMDTIPDLIIPGRVGLYGPTGFAAPGDLNNDGYDDIILTNEEARLFLGGENMDNIPDLIIESAWHGGVGAGDVNGDGYNDFMINCTKEESGRSAKIFFGGATVDDAPDIILEGDFLDNYTYWGHSMDGGNDINNDGYDDIILSASMHNETPGGNEGKVFIYYGGVSMDDVPDITITGDKPLMRLGMRVMILPDLNADGFADVLISEGEQFNEYPGIGLKVYFGGDPMDTDPDVFLGHNFEQDLSVYRLPGSDTVGIVVGDMNLSAVLVYTNESLLPVSDTNTTETSNSIIDFSHINNEICHLVYPNPFNQETQIVYELERSCDVELIIYTILGQKLETLVAAFESAGKHIATWDASAFPGGLYFYRIRAGQKQATGIMHSLR